MSKIFPKKRVEVERLFWGNYRQTFPFQLSSLAMKRSKKMSINSEEESTYNNQGSEIEETELKHFKRIVNAFKFYRYGKTIGYPIIAQNWNAS